MQCIKVVFGTGYLLLIRRPSKVFAFGFVYVFVFQKYLYLEQGEKRLHRLYCSLANFQKRLTQSWMQMQWEFETKIFSL